MDCSDTPPGGDDGRLSVASTATTSVGCLDGRVVLWTAHVVIQYGMVWC